MPDATKVRSIRSADDLDVIEASIRSAAENTIRDLRDMFEKTPPVAAMAAMKFRAIGFDPLRGHPLHLIEQINQMFTYLASCAAVRYLIEKHPDSVPFTMNLGTSPGSDIQSADEQVVAEVFAATHPNSNDKLRRDAAKVRAANAPHKYVFYACQSHDHGERPRLAAAPDVRVISLGCLPGVDPDKAENQLNGPEKTQMWSEERSRVEGRISSLMEEDDGHR